MRCSFDTPLREPTHGCGSDQPRACPTPLRTQSTPLLVGPWRDFRTWLVPSLLSPDFFQNLFGMLDPHLEIRQQGVRHRHPASSRSGEVQGSPAQGIARNFGEIH